MYSRRIYKPDIILSGASTTLTIELYDSGVAVPLTGTWTYTLADYNGDAKVTKSTTLSGTVTSASVTISSADISQLPLGDEYIGRWTSTSLADTFSNDAAITLRDLHCVITEDDILTKEPSLRHVPHRLTQDDDYEAISWTSFIDDAYKGMYDRLCGVHRWPWLTLNPRVFRPYLIDSTLAQIYTSMGPDRAIEASTYATRAEKDWDSINLKVDAGYDNKVTKETKSVSARPYIRLYTVG